jgi:hypothetical protein
MISIIKDSSYIEDFYEKMQRLKTTRENIHDLKKYFYTYNDLHNREIYKIDTINALDHLNYWLPENNKGNIEYKSYLSKCIDKYKYNKLLTQMRWRIFESIDLYNKYETIYILGLYDNGNIASLSRIQLSETIDIIEKISIDCNAVISKITFINTLEGQVAILYIEIMQDKQHLFLINL